MPTKKPSPYHTDFLKLTFGSWNSDVACGESQIQQRDSAAGLSAALISDVFSLVAKALSAHEVRLLFGQNKLRYETCIQHPLGNRGRIDIDFSQITGVAFDFNTPSEPKAGYKVTIQLSSPPSTYVGTQEFGQGLRKTPAVYDTETQIDFSSDGAIKNSRTHSFTVENLNQLEKMKQKMEENGLAEAVARGIDEALLTATFSEEEVAASFEKGRKKTAATGKKTASKKRSAGNVENTGNNNEDTEDGAGPSARKPAQPKKPNPKAVPGLLDHMPEDAGPWLEKCVERWNLIAPFDPTITDEMWESYYRERAALDWFVNEGNGLAVLWDDDFATGKKEGKPTPEWTEDFPKPPMYPYSAGERFKEEDTPKNHMNSIGKALKKLIKGCPQLAKEDGASVEDLGEKLAAGIYVLGGYINWDDDWIRTADCQTRLYSPYGLGTAVDLKLRWHYRERMTFVEHLGNVNFAVRSAEDIDHLAPQKSAVEDKFNSSGTGKPSSCLFSLDRADSGYLKRTLVAANKLRAAEEALFGCKNLLSDRKIFNILMNAVCSIDCRFGCINKDLDRNFVPFSRRKLKKFVGETGDESDNDYDSENEARKKNKKSSSSKKKKLSEVEELFGAEMMPGCGYGDSDDEDGERGEECCIM